MRTVRTRLSGVRTRRFLASAAFELPRFPLPESLLLARIGAMAVSGKLVELYAEPPVVEVIDRLAAAHDLTRSAVVDAALRLLAAGFKPSQVRVAPRRVAGVRIPLRLVDKGSLRAWNRVSPPRSARLRGVFLDVASGREGVEERLAEELALAPLRRRRWPRSATDPSEEDGRVRPE